MQVISSAIDGLLEIIPKTFPDKRGWFFELYKQNEFAELGIMIDFIQDNISFSNKGVLRGLHMQLPPYDQAKLVSVLSGRVLDVVVDLRKNSPSFGQVAQFAIDSDRHNMVFVPEGFAHGIVALEDSIFLYKISKPYHPSSECGIVWNDPDLNIQWPISDPIISDKDRSLPTLNELLGKSVISRF